MQFRITSLGGFLMKWKDWSALGKAGLVLAGIAVVSAVSGLLLLSKQDSLWVLASAMVLLVIAIICELAGAFQAADRGNKG
ncbi:MAG: hypothetical protein Q7S05_03150 [bacterium]|nr:hypothetical protein [bacterium]